MALARVVRALLLPLLLAGAGCAGTAYHGSLSYSYGYPYGYYHYGYPVFFGYYHGHYRYRPYYPRYYYYRHSPVIRPGHVFPGGSGGGKGSLSSPGRPIEGRF